MYIMLYIYICVQHKYDASMSSRVNISILCQDRLKKEVNNSLYNFL